MKLGCCSHTSLLGEQKEASVEQEEDLVEQEEASVELEEKVED